MSALSREPLCQNPSGSHLFQAVIMEWLFLSLINDPHLLQTRALAEFLLPERLSEDEKAGICQPEGVFCLRVSPQVARTGWVLADPRYAEVISAFHTVSEMLFDVRLPINNPARNEVLRRQ